MAYCRKSIGFKELGLLSGLMSSLISPALADGLKDSDASATPTLRGVWFSGIDWVKDARYIFDGASIALNGDLSRDGFALRAYGSRTDFNRDPGDGRTWQGDVMLGYIFSRAHLYGDVYVGVDHQDVRLSPDDPTERVRGGATGLKVAAGVGTNREVPHYFNLSGSYSTAFDTYWARARLGLTHNKLVLGTEAIAFGDVGFDAQRLGGFLIFDLKLARDFPIEVTLSAGHQFVSGSESGIGIGSGGGEGTYGSISFSFAF
jgi:hypothetical protein